MAKGKPGRKPKVLALMCDDFLGGTVLMSPATVGVYIRLLVTQRNKGPLPFDVGRLSRAGGCTEAEFEAAWKSDLECCFETDDQGRIFNPRVEADREFYEDLVAKRSAAGKAGASARWENKGLPRPGRAPKNGKRNGKRNSKRNSKSHDKDDDNRDSKGGGKSMASLALALALAPSRSPESKPSATVEISPGSDNGADGEARKPPDAPPHGVAAPDDDDERGLSDDELIRRFEAGELPPPEAPEGDEYDLDEGDYVQAVIAMYTAPPWTPSRPSRMDMKLARQLYRDGYHLQKVQGGIATVWNRRKPDAKPVRSLAYFREAILAHVAEDEDIDRSRDELQKLWEDLMAGATNTSADEETLEHTERSQ